MELINDDNKLKEELIETYKKQYFLPCETEFDSKAILLACNNDITDYDKIYDFIKSKLDINIKRENVGTKPEGFLQDKYIILKNSIDKDKHLVLNMKGITEPGFSLGGNFISDPEHKFIFCIKDIEKNYIYKNTIKLLEILTDQQIIEIDYNFLHDKCRHIDEIMCFIPFKSSDYSIKNYKIIFTKLDFTILEASQMWRLGPDSKIKTNFPETKDYINKKEKEIKKQIFSFVYNNGDSKEDDESKEDFNYNNLFIEHEVECWFSLQTEQIENFIFQIGPLTNRLLIKNDDIYNCFFPLGKKKEDNLIDELKKIIRGSGIKIKIHTYDLSAFHKFSNSIREYPGGNFHCLIKNIY